MPVPEIKNPSPPADARAPIKPVPEEVREITGIIRIKRHEGRQPEQRHRSRPAPGLRAAAGEKVLRQLVAQANQNLEQLKVPLHLVLILDGDDYLLEVFDCTENRVCRSIKDLEVSPAALPALLDKLRIAAGLLVDSFW